MYDLIVVGAGPAGSICARRAAELGLSTLVLEKATFPRPKPCASGLSARALARVGAEVEPIVHDRVDTIRIELGEGTRIRWRGPECVLATTTRKELDPLLAASAEAAGARLEFGRRVRSVVSEDGGVTVATGTDRLRARFVVGADGPWSVVRRSAGLNASPHGGAIYVRAFPRDSGVLSPFAHSITLDARAARRGYGWIFPKRDHLNVGVYRRAPLSGGFTTALSRFLSRKSFDAWRLEGPYAFPIPIAVRRDGLGGERMVLAGDAAGLADPITGEGISHAIASGRVAAEAVADAASTGAAPLEAYRYRIMREVLPEVNAVRAVGRLCYAIGPKALALTVRAPALRAAIVRLGPWGRLGAEGGELVVETA